MKLDQEYLSGGKGGLPARLSRQILEGKKSGDKPRFPTWEGFEMSGLFCDFLV